MKRKFRVYKMVKGSWGIGLGFSSAGPWLEFARWVFCYDYYDEGDRD